MSNKRTVAGAVLLFEQNSVTRFLAVKERSWPKRDRKWGIPKGKRERSESLWDCMVREVKEEVGVDLTKIPMTVIGRCRRARTYIVFIVLHAVPVVKIQRREIKTFRWVAPEECHCVLNDQGHLASWISPQTPQGCAKQQCLVGNKALCIVTQNFGRMHLHQSELCA